jgi:hypothetical protein
MLEIDRFRKFKHTLYDGGLVEIWLQRYGHDMECHDICWHSIYYYNNI